MNEAEFDRICRALPKTERVVKWGGRAVWKVGGKLFAIGGMEADGGFAVTFKRPATTFETLRTAPGMRPAPYLASRGITWLQRTGPDTLDDAALEAYVAESRRRAVGRLTKTQQVDLGLADTNQRRRLGARHG